MLGVTAQGARVLDIPKLGLVITEPLDIVEYTKLFVGFDGNEGVVEICNEHL